MECEIEKEKVFGPGHRHHPIPLLLHKRMGGEELGDDLKRRVDELLVNAEAMPLEVDSASECHHAIVYPSAVMARQKLITLLAADKRPGVKNKSIRV